MADAKKRKLGAETPTRRIETEAALLQWCRAYFDTVSDKMTFENFAREEGGRGCAPLSVLGPLVRISYFRRRLVVSGGSIIARANIAMDEVLFAIPKTKTLNLQASSLRPFLLPVKGSTLQGTSSDSMQWCQNHPNNLKTNTGKACPSKQPDPQNHPSCLTQLLVEVTGPL